MTIRTDLILETIANLRNTLAKNEVGVREKYLAKTVVYDDGSVVGYDYESKVMTYMTDDRRRFCLSVVRENDSVIGMMFEHEQFKGSVTIELSKGSILDCNDNRTYTFTNSKDDEIVCSLKGILYINEKLSKIYYKIFCELDDILAEKQL